MNEVGDESQGVQTRSLKYMRRGDKMYSVEKAVSNALNSSVGWQTVTGLSMVVIL